MESMIHLIHCGNWSSIIISLIINVNFSYAVAYRGSSDATKQAHTLIAALIKDPDVDILQMLPKSKLTVVTTSTWDKTVPTVAVRPYKYTNTYLKLSGTTT